MEHAGASTSHNLDHVALDVLDPVNLVYRGPTSVPVKIYDGGVMLERVDGTPATGQWAKVGRYVVLGARPAFQLTTAPLPKPRLTRGDAS